MQYESYRKEVVMAREREREGGEGERNVRMENDRKRQTGLRRREPEKDIATSRVLR
jgi:hypothetical protein